MQVSKAYIFFFCKWLLLILVVSIAAGTLSAFFLNALSWATDFRAGHQWMLYLLPAAGLTIGLLYHYTGKSIERGNNLVFDTIHNPGNLIPFRMAPLVLVGTVVTHLFGGSAGREGTALQMSAATADQLNKWFKISKEERIVLLIAGLSAGFASVFGTPWAGAMFGIEVLLLKKFPYQSIVPALITAFLAAQVTMLWGVGHTHYHIAVVPAISGMLIVYSIFAGVVFSAGAIIFVSTTRGLSKAFKIVKYAPLRPFIGGVIIVILVLSLNTHRYLGLGIPVILEAFEQTAMPVDFMLKIVFTAITLSAGFKGGEVTPLFFIGATLGSALSLVLPLPVGLLAGMGFVAVFAGAAKTPVACCIMGLELFGWSCGVYVGIACAVAYLISGKQSIYNAPENKLPSHFLFGKPVQDLKNLFIIRRRK